MRGASAVSRSVGPCGGGELVAGQLGLGLGGALGGQLGERALDLAPDPADGDAEDALAALEQVDDLVVARCTRRRWRRRSSG